MLSQLQQDEIQAMFLQSQRLDPLPAQQKFKTKSKSRPKSSQDTEYAKQPHKSPSIKIMYTNADILTSNKREELVQKVIEEVPLIICITEVLPKNPECERTEDDYKIENYKMRHNLESNGRGMIIYLHESIIKSVVKVESPVAFEELILLEVRLLAGDKLLLGLCYRSGSKSSTSDVNNALLNEFITYVGRSNYSHKCILGVFLVTSIGNQYLLIVIQKLVTSVNSWMQLKMPTSFSILTI